MNNNMHDEKADIPEHTLEQAAIWQARLRESERASGEDPRLRADFSAWLMADRRHRQAFAEMEALWGALEEPVASAMAGRDRTDQRTTGKGAAGAAPRRDGKRSLPGLAIAACLLLAMLVGIGWQQDWPNRWQSDYVTGVGEQTPIELDDGSRITLNTQSAVAVEYTQGERRVRLLKGEAWFEVASDLSRPFTVTTGQGTVEVTGTRFNLRLEASAAVVSLDEGRVQLRAGEQSGNAVALAPGQQARLTEEGILATGSFDRTAVTGWLRHQFVFYDTPLAQVVQALNRHRAGRILIVDEGLNRLRVSGVFSTREPDDALDIITSTLPVEQTRITDYLVLLR